MTMIFFFTGEWESCSEEEDESDGEWVDVYHSSDEEQQKVGLPVCPGSCLPCDLSSISLFTPVKIDALHLVLGLLG